MMNEHNHDSNPYDVRMVPTGQPGEYFAESTQAAGIWYRLTGVNHGPGTAMCSCIRGKYRKECKHVAAALARYYKPSTYTPPTDDPFDRILGPRKVTA